MIVGARNSHKGRTELRGSGHDLSSVNGRVLNGTDRTLTEEGLRNGSRAVPTGSLVLSTRAPIGYVAEAAVRTAFNQGCRGLVPVAPVSIRYFCYQLLSLADRLNARGQGSTFVELSGDALAAFPVVVPPLPAQRAIADYLDRETARIDALIAAKRRMVELLEERAVASIEDAALTPSWESVALSRVITRIEQGWSPQCDARPPDEGEWGVLKVGCVNRGQFKADEAKALPLDLAPRMEYLIREGDLLMSRANTRDLVGSTAVVSDVRPRTLLCDKLYRIRLDERRARPRFVSLWLQTRVVRSQVELEATGASDSMQNIGQDTVRRISVPLPSLKQQEAFEGRCDRERARIGRGVDCIQQQISLFSKSADRPSSPRRSRDSSTLAEAA